MTSLPIEVMLTAGIVLLALALVILSAIATRRMYDLAAYMRPQWLDGEDTGMTLEAYFGDSICQTRNGFVTMDKKGYSFDLED